MAAVEADVVGADAGGEGGVEKEFVARLWNFKKQVSRLYVPIQWEQSVALFKPGGFFGNRDG